MKGPRLTELPVKQLEHIFSPPGLPLPLKGDSEQGTTSILIRGGAGTGKTTFAMALAHAIAKEGGGLVLYLTTEFSPVEIAFKATLLGLAEQNVGVWPGVEGMLPGDVVVEHLSVVRRGQPVLTSAERKRSSIDAVWGLLHPEKPGERRPPRPVRAIVIDALTLPEGGESEEALRAYVVEFVQALENEGVSVLLVEELAPGAAAWSSFVVDVVFELSFQPDPETQELRRKLTLSKCRYSLSIPGPHDYGLEGGIPGIWPDLFRVLTGGHGFGVPPFRVHNPPTLSVPFSRQGKWTPLGTSIVVSAYDKTHADAINVLRRSPGIKSLMVHCGVQTIIGEPPDYMTVFDNEGVHAIGWAILYVAGKTGSNVCIFQGMDGLLSRPGSMTLVLHMLKGLTGVGFMVCMHSPYDAIRPLLAAVDLVWGGMDKAKLQSSPPRCHRAFMRHYVRAPWMLGDASLGAQISQIESARDIETLQMAYTSMNPTAGLLRLTTAQEWAGNTLAGDRFSQLMVLEGRDGHYAAWLALHTGNDWHAARAALAAVESDTPAATMLLLWKAVCAAVAHNHAAINELKAALATADEPLILDPLLRGLAATNQIDEADRIITDLAARHPLAPWMLDRLRADVRLDAQDTAVLRDAATRLAALTADDALPLIHRAETWYNLGTAHDRLGEQDAALLAFERAATLNPLLDHRTPSPSS